jgi:hypothetical protein
MMWPAAKTRAAPLHGEEPPVSGVEDPAGERLLQLIGQGVLPVQVTADRGGDGFIWDLVPES